MKCISVLGAVLFFAGIGHVEGTTYNARQDFSGEQNPNGTWTYGYRPRSTDPLISFSHYDHTPRDIGDPVNPDSPIVWHSRDYIFCGCPHVGLIPEDYQDTGEFVAGPDDILFHPAPGAWATGADLDWAVIRWTAPSDGTGNLYVKYGGVYGEGTGLRDLYVYKNSTQLYSTMLVGTETATYTNDSIALEGGDYIDFAVGPHDTWGADWTSIAAIIEFDEQPTNPNTITYNARQDFSEVNNPSGAWSYGWSNTLGEGMTVYPDYTQQYAGDWGWRDNSLNDTNDIPAVAQLDETWWGVTLGPDDLVFHPGPEGEYSIIRWIAPEDGTVDLDAGFAGIHFGNTEVFVYHNADMLFDDSLYGYAVAPPFSSNFSVNAGDTIDFAVGIIENAGAATTSCSAIIDFTPVPEPSSIVLLLMGATALLVFRRR